MSTPTSHIINKKLPVNDDIIRVNTVGFLKERNWEEATDSEMLWKKIDNSIESFEQQAYTDKEFLESVMPEFKTAFLELKKNFHEGVNDQIYSPNFYYNENEILQDLMKLHQTSSMIPKNTPPIDYTINLNSLNTQNFGFNHYYFPQHNYYNNAPLNSANMINKNTNEFFERARQPIRPSEDYKKPEIPRNRIHQKSTFRSVKNKKIVYVHNKETLRKLNEKVNEEKKEILKNKKYERIFESRKRLKFLHHKARSQPVPDRNKNRGSKFRGVSRNGNLWQVLIMILKKKRYVGSYDNEIDAAKSYDKVALQFHGSRAKTNFQYTEVEIEKILKEDPPTKFKHLIYGKQ